MSTKEERQLIVKDVIHNLSLERLSASEFNSIRDLMRVLQSFQEHGGRHEGSISFPEFDRIIEYKLSDKPYQTPYVRLVKQQKYF